MADLHQDNSPRFLPVSQTGPHGHDKKGRYTQHSQFNKWFININNNIRGNVY